MEESPFTKVPNSIFDIEGLNAYERLILLYIVRKTIGFNKKSDGISLSQFMKLTGVSKPTVIKAIENLKRLKFIRVQKQTNKNGGKSFNRYTPLVKEIDYLVKQIDKGSKGDLLGLVKDVDIQKNNNTKENKQKREREIIKENIFYTLSENEMLKEIERYISHLIDNENYIKSESAFRMKIKKQLDKSNKQQLEDFEKYYLEYKCQEYKNKYIGKYVDSYEISNIYPYFETERYNPKSKFIIWLDPGVRGDEFSKAFSNKEDIEIFLQGALEYEII